MGKVSSKHGKVSSKHLPLPLRSRKDEVRSLLKKCFKNDLFGLVPFEIWRNLIVLAADLRSIVILSQTCFAFKELVEIFGENNFGLALLLRNENQIRLARKYLFKCAENNNATAMFHLGYAYHSLGWGLKRRASRSAEWFKKSAEAGNCHSMAFYAYCLKNAKGVNKDVELSNLWAKKALSSNDSFAIGCCHFYGLSCKQDHNKAFPFFEASAKDGDEFGEYFTAFCYFYENGVEPDLEKAFYWYLRSAEQGLRYSQTQVTLMYRHGFGCKADSQLAGFWKKKFEMQSEFE